MMLRLYPPHLEGFDSWSGLPVAVAGDGAHLHSGKGRTLNDRVTSACHEFYEREFMRSDTSGVMAPIRSAPRPFIPPEAFGLDQPDSLPENVSRPSEGIAVRWRQFTNDRDGDVHWLHDPRADEAAFHRPTSNGVAINADADEARERALLELIERDSFMAWWWSGFGARRLALLTQAITVGYPNTQQADAVTTWELPARPGFRVVLCAVFTGGLEEPEGVVVGCASARDGADSLDMGRHAFDECAQALDAMALTAASCGVPFAPLTRFRTPEGALRVLEHLEGRQGASPLVDLSAPLTSMSRVARSRRTGLWWARVVAPEAVPFALPGRGTRSSHHSLAKLAAAGGADVEMAEHHPLA